MRTSWLPKNLSVPIDLAVNIAVRLVEIVFGYLLDEPEHREANRQLAHKLGLQRPIRVDWRRE